MSDDYGIARITIDREEKPVIGEKRRFIVKCSSNLSASMTVKLDTLSGTVNIIKSWLDTLEEKENGTKKETT